ncbi:MAG: sulfatase [Deltaproteobacteria bacterium]|nr:sulfatase [Deltaproteobacteria bacterium]
MGKLRLPVPAAAGWLPMARAGLLLLALVPACSRKSSPGGGGASGPVQAVAWSDGEVEAVGASGPFDGRLDLFTLLGDVVYEGAPGHVELGFPVLRDDQREAFMFTPPLRLRFRNLPLRPEARLVFGYGITIRKQGEAAPIEFRVELDRGAGLERLFAETVQAKEPGANEWLEADVALPAPAEPGARCDLVLSVDGGREGLIADWSWPAIVSDRRDPAPDRSTVAAEPARQDLLEQFPQASRLANPQGKAPHEIQVGLMAEMALRPAVVVPQGSSLRYRIHAGPSDSLRFRFHVLPHWPADGSGRAGTVGFTVRSRPAVDASGDAVWTTSGKRALAIEPGAVGPWPREASGLLPLGLVADGEVELELAASSDLPQEWATPGFTQLEVVTQRSVPRRARGDGGRNVVVLLADSLRMDHVGLYGYDRDTTPHLDAAARERGVIFDQATAAASWTLPSVASLFTGVYPVRHRVIHPERSLLPASWQTWADQLRAAGYSTAGFTSNPLLGRDHGFIDGFEDQHEELFAGAGRLMERVADWIASHKDERFFVYAHFMEPHAPYVAPAPFYDMFDPGYTGSVDHDTWSIFGNPAVRPMVLAIAGGFPVDVRDDLGEQSVREGERIAAGPPLLRRLMALYDGEVRWFDEQLGKMLDLLAAQGLEGETLVVVVSDHGEEFGEHGHYGHSFDLYDTLLHVPLVFLDPDATGPRHVAAQVSLVDVLPMLLERLGLPIPEGLDGLTLAQAEAAGPERVVFGQTSHYVDSRAGANPDRTEAVCARNASRKLIHVPRDDGWEAYELVADPAERSPVAADDAAFAEWRATLVETAAPLWSLAHRAPRPPARREEAILRALGYIE